MNNKIVARYKDGRLVKGISLDIHPSRPIFHVRTPDGNSATVNLGDLKAVFYVRTLEGDSARDEDLNPKPGDARSRGSSMVTMRFADGETMVCLSNGTPTNRPYFFVVPVDAQSNNIRILVNQAALTSIEMSVNEPAPVRV